MMVVARFLLGRDSHGRFLEDGSLLSNWLVEGLLQAISI